MRSRVHIVPVRSIAQLNIEQKRQEMRDNPQSLEPAASTPEALARRSALRLKLNAGRRQRGLFGPGFSENGNW